MENSKEILNKINSGESALIAEAVEEIKENGDLSMAEALLQNLEKLHNARNITTVVDLLADIKKNAFREMLIRKIRDTASPAVRSELLRIIWESSLDYSAYLELFTELLRDADFSVAFEASTVIENMLHRLTDKQRRSLQHTLSDFPEDKQLLIANIRTEMDCCHDD